MGVRSSGIVLVAEEVFDGEGDVGVPAVDGGDVKEEVVVTARKHPFLYFQL
jgi:hypothetical protein